MLRLILASYNKYFFLSIFLVVLCSTCVLGVGIGQYSPATETLFQSGIEKTYTFYLFDNSRIHASLEGDLAPYATINDSNPDGPPRNIEVIIKFPAYLEPGIHSLYLVATEATTNNAAMGGIASVRTGIKVFSLYPFKHPVFNGVTTNDLNINETANIGLSVTNYGEETINSANGFITVYDENNQTIAILPTETKSIGSFETQTLNAVLDAAEYNLSAGKYTAVGNVSYDGFNINYTSSGTFMVGELNVNIVDTTASLIVNATNEYDITLESDWAGDLDNVYAKITTPKGDIIKTPDVDLVKPGNGRKAAGQLQTYIETKGLDIGTYDYNITVYYKDQSFIKTVSVNIIDGVPPKIVKPQAVSNDMIIIILAILIVLAIAAYIILFNKHLGATTRRKDDNKTVSNDDIRPPTL